VLAAAGWVEPNIDCDAAPALEKRLPPCCGCDAAGLALMFENKEGCDVACEVAPKLEKSPPVC